MDKIVAIFRTDMENLSIGKALLPLLLPNLKSLHSEKFYFQGYSLDCFGMYLQILVRPNLLIIILIIFCSIDSSDVND